MRKFSLSLASHVALKTQHSVDHDRKPKRNCPAAIPFRVCSHYRPREATRSLSEHEGAFRNATTLCETQSNEKMSERSVSFVVEGRPVGKERPRFSRRKGRVYTPTKSKAYEIKVGLRGKEAMQRSRSEGGWPLPPFAVVIDIVWQDDRRPDVDNVAKSVLDGLNGIAWKDDKQVTCCTVRSAGYDRARPRITVTIASDTPTHEAN